jgi:gliding motility-associated protein GldM
MLALNMSKEVLSAFGLMNEKLTEANTATTQRNTAFMSNLATKASEQPEQYGSIKAKADQISQLSDELSDYLGSVKSDLMKDVEDPNEYEEQDKSDHFDQKFFRGGKLSPEGKEFVENINTYREGVKSVLGADYPGITKNVENQFDTQPVVNKDGVKVEWLSYNFEGFPLIATRTKLTQMQADIKTTESEMLSKMLAGQQATALSFTQYNTLLETNKSAYYSGEKFEGAIVLGRKDPNTKPNRVELTLDGRKLTEDQYTIENGKVKLNISAGSPGDHKIEGNLIFIENGEETPIEVNQSFATISMPNSAVISADKMNVVYRGVSNPMTISIPGIPDNKVNASAAGLSKVNGSHYIMKPGKGRTVTISANGTLPDGKGISTKSEFRIKDIPRPTGTIRGEDGGGGPVRMARQGLEISSVGATLIDFDFDLNLNVTSFSFKVSGQPTIKVNGTKLDSAAKSALRRAGRGETVQIFDINAKISGNSGYKLKKISPVFIELTN